MNLALKLAALGLVLAGGAAYLLRSDPGREGVALARGASTSAESRARPGAERAPANEVVVAQRQALPSSSAAAPQPVEPIPPSTAAISTGSLHVTATWSDGTSAAGVHVNVVDVGRVSYDPLTALTDAAGECTVSGLGTGKVWVTLDRRESWDKADITAGEETDLAIQIQAGFDVEGVVVDENQVPVAGATVWCGQIWGGPENSFAVATSGADGTFAVRSCPRLASIWARADGHAPSLRRTIEDADVSPVSVTLALTGASASVSGRVLDPDGAPVEGALVLVDGQDMLFANPLTLPGGRTTYLSHSGPTSVRTDADGRFAVAGVMPGTVPLGVLAQGYSAWRGSVDAAAGTTAEKEITLTAGFRVSGTVRDAAGNPAAGRVAIWAARLSTQLSPTVMTGPDGAYEIDGISPGEIEIWADGHDGDAAATLTGQAGDELTWDAILGPEDPNGVPWIETQAWGE